MGQKMHITKFITAKFQILFGPGYLMPSSADPDEAAHHCHHELPHPNLHCLQINFFHSGNSSVLNFSYVLIKKIFFIMILPTI